MGHEDSKRKRRLYYFFGITLPISLFVFGASLLIFIPTVISGTIPIGWAIFFICYSASLIILDFIWFSDKLSKAYISWRAKRFGKKDYAARRRKREQLLEKLERHPELKPRYEELADKRFLLICLGIIEVIILFVLVFIVGEPSTTGLIGLITFFVTFGVIIVVGIFVRDDEKKKRKARKLDRERRELRRFKASHNI